MSEKIYLSVRVHPQRHPPRVEKKDSALHIYLSSPPENGKANKELIALLSHYLKCPQKSLTIARGHKGKEKKILWIKEKDL